MIVKRPCKLEMPDLKRCGLDDSGWEEDDYGSLHPKKQRTATVCSVPVDSLGLCDNDATPRSSSVTEGSSLGEETESDSKNTAPKRSRGRVPVLPSRFNNSVIGPWKDCKSKFADIESGLHEIYLKRRDNKMNNVENFSYDGYIVKKEEKLSLPSYRSHPYCQDSEEDGMGSFGSNDFVFSKSLVNKQHSQPLVKSNEYLPMPQTICNWKGMSKVPKENIKQKKAIYGPEDFSLGDIVWAKSGKRYPSWPAIVIDPMLQAPETVLRSCIPGAICVMYFGYSKNGKQRDYSWVKRGMIFPFLECLDRFQGQTELHKSKPSDFRMAIEEAFLAEQGFMDGQLGIGKDTSYDSKLNGFHEAAGSNQVPECPPQDQVIEKGNDKKRDTQPCSGCGLVLALKLFVAHDGRLLCKHCVKLLKSKQYCGVCKKIWHHSDGGSWVCCDGCDVWVHAECAEISGKYLKDLEDTEYYCPDCKPKFAFEPSYSRTPPKVKQKTVANEVVVVCNGMEATYIRSLHLVVCMCGRCGTRRQSLSEWEKHTGCRAKKWKYSVKVKGSMITLHQWLTDFGANVCDTQKLDRSKLFGLLQEKYEAVSPKWTTERCAICRWVEDWDDNKIIICNRCQIAVHQECYGSKSIKDLTSWVCRACEIPDVQKECCLCPVKGGALKPTDVDTLWVHVTCAWFQPEVAFYDHERMEPAMGILRISSHSFVKKCVICKQIHGSCIQCCKCATYYHAVSASRAGYCMENT